MRSPIFVKFINWHFFEMPQEILRIWKGFLRFNLNFFSLRMLVRTFFAPWHKYQYSYGRGFDFKRYLETFSFNALARVMGAMVRTILIIIGLVSEFFLFCFGVIVFFAWILLPILFIAGIIFGFSMIL